MWEMILIISFTAIILALYYNMRTREKCAIKVYEEKINGMITKKQLFRSENNELRKENDKLRKLNISLCNHLLQQNVILNSFKENPKPLDDEQLNEFIMITDILFDNFTKRIQNEMSWLTKEDLRICCFIKLRLTVSEIAIALSISPSSVSKQKQRMKQQIEQKYKGIFGKGKSLDLWILEY